MVSKQKPTKISLSLVLYYIFSLIFVSVWLFFVILRSAFGKFIGPKPMVLRRIFIDTRKWASPHSNVITLSFCLSFLFFSVSSLPFPLLFCWCLHRITSHFTLPLKLWHRVNHHPKYSTIFDAGFKFQHLFGCLVSC